MRDDFTFYSRPPGDAVMEPVLLRLRQGPPCSPELVRRFEALGSRVEALPAGAVLQVEDEAVRRPRYLLSGWACRFRHLPDGRRQIFDLVLPGEGVGVCLRPSPLANTSTAALTPVRLADAASLMHAHVLDAQPDLRPALLAQADLDERRALAQIVRLGRLAALERLANLFMEMRERLEVIGHVEGERFAMPLTQEILADMIGLSIVHVNRTLQELRRRKLVEVGRGIIQLLDVPALLRIAQYRLARTPEVID